METATDDRVGHNLEDESSRLVSSDTLGEKSGQEPEIADNGSSPPTTGASNVRLLFATICFSGLQFGWALQIALLTPFILEIGMDKVWITIVWLCGPVAGLVVQPIVGVLSDRCTSRFGRRRPFILFGAICIIVSQLIIPNSLDLGHLLGDPIKGTKHWAIAFVVVGFWILDFSNNMLQGPCRAMMADIASNSQQEVASAMLSVWLAIGNVTGYLAGFVPWKHVFRGINLQTEACGEGCTSLRICFAIAIVFLSISTIITLFAAKETPLSAAPKSQGFVLFFLFKRIFTIPGAMLRVCLVQFFSWFAWFTFLIYITNWVGENVFKGVPDSDDQTKRELYLQGVQWGSFGLAGFSVVSLITSPFIPKVIQFLGPRIVWFAGELCLTLSLVLTFFVTEKYVALILISSFGLPWSVSMTVPFALTAIIAPREEKGIYMGILNIFVVIPQLIMAGLGPLIIHMSPNKDVVFPLLCGAASALVSCFLVWIVKTNAKSEEGEVVAPVIPTGH